MKTKIKICGLNSIEHIETAEKVGAFWYGLIFFNRSPRNISLKNASYLIKKTPKNISPVAILVDPTLDTIKNLIDIGIDTIQLHGSENISFCKKIKNNYKLKIIKAINVKKSNDILAAQKYTNYVDWVLFDSTSKSLPGGTGSSFNWAYLNNKKLKFKWILSGGLNCNNVGEAINSTQANALDVSSGIEIKPGKKSNTLIEKFVNSVKIVEEKNFAKKKIL